jgi:peptide/nickel transport system permease protein
MSAEALELVVEPTIDRRATRRVLRQPTTVVGIVIVTMWVIIAVAAPLFAPYAPNAQTAALLQGPSGAHVFGTDELGRDIFTRVLYGARTSFPVAVIVVLLSLAIGGTLGALAGYFGRLVDGITMRLCELVFAFPTIILAMAVAAAFGSGLRNAALAIVFVSWPFYARVVRAAVLGLKHEDFLATARLLGKSSLRTLVQDVLPNVVGPVLVLATLELGNAILILASLSFLGLGVRPPTSEWGSMVAGGSLDFTRWWLGTFAGIAILTAVLGFNLLGDALRDRLDPQIARSLGRR